MPDLSTRLKLTLPTNLESMSLGDNVLSDAWDKVDTNCHCRIVTDLASVTDAFEGMHVYSQADDKNYIRKNSTFIPITGSGTGGSPSNPGVIGYKAQTNSTTLVTLDSTSTQRLIVSTTFSAVANNTYLVFINIPQKESGTAGYIAGQLNVRHASGVTTTSSSTLAITLTIDTADPNSFSKDTVAPSPSVIVPITPTVTGNYTVAVWGIKENQTAGATKDINPLGTLTNMTVYDATAVS